MDGYSISELLEILKRERATGIRLEVGNIPVLFTKEKPRELEGPDLTEESIDVMLRDVSSTRDLRVFRRKGRLDIIVRLNNRDFLVRAIRAFGECSFEVHAVPA